MNHQWIAQCTAALLFIFAAVSAQAQFQPQQQPGETEEIEVTDEEIQVFVDASIKAQQIQNEAQMEMVGVVEKEGLDVETYNKILQGMQMGQSPEELEVDASKVEQFEKASEQIGEIEQEMEGKLIAAIEDEGMDLDRYQQIFVAIQTNPELQQKMQQVIMESQMQQGGQPGY